MCVAVAMEKCRVQSWSVMMMIVERRRMDARSVVDWQGEGFVELMAALTSRAALLRTALGSEKLISLMHHVICRYTVV